MPNSLFAQSQASSTSTRQNQNMQKQANSPRQENQSRPSSSSAISSRNYQSRSSSNVTTDTSNHRDNQSHSHTSTNGLMQIPNQFFPQQMMQSMQNQSRAPSNLSAAMAQNSQGQIQQRQASNNSSQSSSGKPTMLQQMGNVELQFRGMQHPESRASFSRRGSNSDNKSVGSVDPNSQRFPPQNHEMQKPSQTNAPSGSEPHQNQQVQAQAWFLVQQVQQVMLCVCKCPWCFFSANNNFGTLL
jgi:hypothetical protein